MKFTVDELVAKLPRPANEKWTEGVWDVEPFAKHRFENFTDDLATWAVFF